MPTNSIPMQSMTSSYAKYNSGLMSFAKDVNMSDTYKYSLVLSFKDFRGFKKIQNIKDRYKIG